MVGLLPCSGNSGNSTLRGVVGLTCIWKFQLNYEKETFARVVRVFCQPSLATFKHKVLQETFYHVLAYSNISTEPFFRIFLEKSWIFKNMLLNWWPDVAFDKDSKLVPWGRASFIETGLLYGRSWRGSVLQYLFNTYIIQFTKVFRCSMVIFIRSSMSNISIFWRIASTFQPILQYEFSNGSGSQKSFIKILWVVRFLWYQKNLISSCFERHFHLRVKVRPKQVSKHLFDTLGNHFEDFN